MKLLSLAAASLAALAWADAAAAQEATPAIRAGGGEGAVPAAAVPPEPVPTNIQADTGRLGLGTQVTKSGNIYTIDSGTRAGANLFHSFSRFDLGQGDFARWVHSGGDPAGIRVVVNRVTGGDPSGIFGTIDSTALPNADFFFINPAGIVFGVGAQVNVPAAAHFSTARELRFADGVAFTIAAPDGSTFSVAAPASFGFTGSEGDIDVAGTGPLFAATDISLVAANISLRQAHVEAASVQVAATGRAAAVIPVGALPGEPLAGRIHIGGDRSPAEMGDFDTKIVASGAGGVRLAAGALHAERASITGARVAIEATEANLVRSVVSSDGSANGEAGSLSMQGRTLRLESSQIESKTSGPGAGGLIELAFSDVALSGSARISSNAGEQCLEPPCGAETGDAGHILVRANRLTMIADPEGEGPAIRSDTHGTGAAGTITLDVSEIVLEGAAISSGTTGSGAGGKIVVSADDLTIRRGRVSTNTEGPGAGGSISLAIRRSLSLDDDARISSNSFLGESGAGGTITINAPQVRLTNASKILTETFGRGDAGSIAIAGKELVVRGSSVVSSSTQGSGAGGSLLIDVDRITMSGSDMSASSGNSVDGGLAGRAGSIIIRAVDRLTLEAEEVDGLTIHSLISSNTVTAADAGSVTVDTGFLLMDNSILSSETRGDGQAGTVFVKAGRVHMRNGAAISTTTRIVPGCQGCDETPTGDGGLIRIAVAGDMTLESGSQVLSSTEALGDAGKIQIAAAALLLRGGSISTSAGAGSSGRPGLISIAAPRLEIADAGSIESISRNSSRAGEIAITGEDVRLLGQLSRISSSNEAPGGGDAGSVTISARNISLAQGALVTSSSASGAAGDVTLIMPEDGLLRLESTSSPSLISTSSGPGTGGRIIIADPRAIISNGGSILALGEEGGANVLIGARYFINSSDRSNRVAVDGNFLLEAAAYDVSAGTVNRDLSAIDASGVLRGPCATVRATGSVSQLVVRPIGPYGSGPNSVRPGAAMPPGEAQLGPSCS